MKEIIWTSGDNQIPTKKQIAVINAAKPIITHSFIPAQDSA